MAEAQMAGDSLTKLAEEITCTACHNLYKDPRVLSCCHYFCRECLQKLVGKDGRIGKIVCPTCGDSSVCLKADKLLRVLFVDRLQELYHQLSQLEGHNNTPCGMCSEAVASSFCQQCGDFICNECVSYHRKMKLKFGEHKILSFSELKCKESSILPLQPRQKECSVHEEQCKLYCFDCSKLICRDCTIIDHSKHHFDFVKKTATHFRDSVLQKAAPLKQLQSDVEQATKKISETKYEIQQQQEFVNSHIQNKFSEMIERLRQRERELLSETDQSAQHKLSQLDRQERHLSHTAKGVNSLLEYVNRNLEITPDEDLISIQQTLQDKLEYESKKHTEVQLAPVQAANIAVKIVAIDDLTTIVKEKATVYQFPLSDESEVHPAEVGAETTHYVTDYRDNTHTPASDLSAVLKSAIECSMVNARVIKTGKGLYEVTYTPVVRGRHELELTVNGEHISGIPRPVFAAFPPKQLGPLPIRTLSGFKHPFAAQFDSQGHLLITESSGMKISRLDREGKPLSENGHFNRLDVPNPTGLAIDRSSGDIFVASGSNNSISKYSCSGELLKHVEGKEINELDHPCGLSLVSKELFVCDRNNNRIQVFDLQLNRLRSFGNHGNKPGELHWPYDIVADGKGRIVISDCDNHRLQVFTPQGKVVASIGNRGSSLGQLKRPMGLSLNRTGHMFVTEFENHRLSVFSKDGECVCSLGKYGTGVGDMCYPAGIAVDDDGFVYVCDQGNNRVLVY